jgi:hypothetical protein
MGTQDWAGFISYGNRLRYAGDVITRQRQHTPITGEALERAYGAASLLEAVSQHLAASLRGRDRERRVDRAVEPPIDPDADDDLTQWIQDLTESAYALLASGHD